MHLCCSNRLAPFNTVFELGQWDAGFSGRERNRDDKGVPRARQIEGEIYSHSLSAICGEEALSVSESLSVSAALLGLAVASFLQGAAGAPFALTESPMIVAPNDRSFEEIYYYQGRYYPYRYNSRYYAHRVYRHGHWNYY